MALTPAPTVRETLEAAVETVLPAQPVETAEPIAEAPAVAAEQVVPETTAAAPKDDGRARNPDGTFAKGEEKPKEAPKVEAAAAAPVAPPKPKIARPQSWKKELEAQWETLAPEVQANIIEREKQYQTGVSTYKADADRAKGITTALAQFEPMLQKRGIATDQWIQQMGVAHYLISEGTPMEQVETIASIIKNNGIDVNALGQLLAGQQPQYQQPQVRSPMPQPQAEPINIEAEVQKVFEKRQVEDAYKAFTADVDAGKYPHFADDEVKGTMAGLLQSGLAQDYASAYEAALALPKHRHLVAVAPAAPAPVVDQAKEKQAQAARARSQAVSVKSSTPSTMAQPGGKRSLREELEASANTVLGGSRV